MRNCWQVAAFGREVLAGRMLTRQLLDTPVVLFRRAAGHVVAMEDRCPHRSTPLSKGVLSGDSLRCGYHGLRFDCEGRCVEIPGQTTIPSTARVTTFPVVEKYKLIWIWMGDSDAADVQLVPDVHWLDDPAWIAAEGYHCIAAHYQLLNDNLLDLSHESYVHTRTIGNEAVADTPVIVSHDAQCVQVRKEIAACDPPPFYQYLARVSATTPVRRWQRSTFRPPGYTVIDVGVEALQPPPNSNRVEGRVINLVTPASATRSHYFWAFARNFRLEEHEVTAFLKENVGRTFDEDKEMLEAQQSNLGDEETDPLYKLAIKVDAAPVYARRLLNAIIQKETAENNLAAEESHGKPTNQKRSLPLNLA